MRRHTAAVLGILLGVGLAGCGDTDEPGQTTIDFTNLGPGNGTRATQDQIDRHADDVLLSVYTTGGSGDPGTFVPDVEVRSDGTVYLNGDDGLGVDTFRLTAAGIEEVREQFGTVSFRDADYAESTWTDLPSTSVFTTMGEHPEAFSVDGLRQDDEVEDDDWDRLLGAIGHLSGLAETARTGTGGEIATQRASYRPEQVAAVLRPDPDAGGRPWPLSRPLARYSQGSLEFGDPCIRVTGRDVVTLEALADDGSSGLHWSVGKASVDVVVRPVLPGTDHPCTPKAPETPVG